MCVSDIVYAADLFKASKRLWHPFSKDTDAIKLPHYKCGEPHTYIYIYMAWNQGRGAGGKKMYRLRRGWDQVGMGAGC